MKFTRRQYFFVLILILMIITYLPLLSKQLPPIIGSPYLWSVIWGGSVIIFYPRILTHRVMIIFFLYALFIIFGNLALWPNLTQWNKSGIMKDIMYIGIGLSIYLYFIFTGEYKDFAKIAGMTLIFLFITAIMTVIVTSIDPMYSRMAIDRESESEILAHQTLQRLGAGGYGSSIVIMALFPMLVYYFMNKHIRYNRTLIVFYILFMLFTLIRIQIFANVIIAMIAIAISFAGASRIKTSIATLTLFIIIALVIPRSFYAKTFISIANTFEKQEDINYKFRDLANFVQSGAALEEESTTAYARAMRYPSLYESFIQSPLLGCFYMSDSSGRGYNIAGGHLYWMNKLTVTGIFGFLFFAAIPFLFLRKSITIVPRNMKFYFLIALMSYLSYGFLKNLGGHSWYVFFVIIPGMVYLPLLSRKKVLSEDQSQNIIEEEEDEKKSIQSF